LLCINIHLFSTKQIESMAYTKYFKTGQKILLTLKATAPPSGRIISLTTFFQDAGKDYFDLTLPYGGKEEESYPFFPDMPFILHSEAFGIGLRLSCHFADRLKKDTIRVTIADDLQVFQRRGDIRVDVQAGLRYTKGRGTLRTFHEQWEKNVQILQHSKDLSKLGTFPKRLLNLSTGGMRFDIKGTVEIADICLVFLDIGTPPPICALAEVVWVQETESKGRFSSGMRFVSLLDSDRNRLELYVNEEQRLRGKENP
jgi:c-di-GMP-binding flagellar brake protein YcgR